MDNDLSGCENDLEVKLAKTLKRFQNGQLFTCFITATKYEFSDSWKKIRIKDLTLKALTEIKALYWIKINFRRQFPYVIASLRVIFNQHFVETNSEPKPTNLNLKQFVKWKRVSDF